MNAPKATSARRGIRLGRLFGIEIRLDFSVLLIFMLIVYSLATGILVSWHPDWSPPQIWSVALSTAILFFASLLAHELSHSVVAQRFGLPVPRITLFLFGGVAEMEREPDRPWQEFVIAIAGPAMSFALGFLFLNLAGTLAGPGWLERLAAQDQAVLAELSPFATMMLWLGSVNLVLAVFNLIPGFPLDGGRVFRAIMWGITGDQLRATRWASDLGRYFGWTLMALGALSLFRGGGVQGLWLILIGWFLSHLARASYEQLLTQRSLGGMRVGDLMRTRFDQVAPDIGILEFIDNHLLRSAQQLWPVIDRGRLVGTVALSDVIGLAAPDRQRSRVADVMRPLAQGSYLDPGLSGDAVLQRLVDSGTEPLAVVRDGQVVGLIHRGDILKWLALHRP
jgi:Zn-dependent protease